ncbi:hypothetical protein [Zhongshania borealis]|uniref:hypothetical protein n=1 Tax=Zhongshania borealis TaxID=889488 RepID=UPI0031E6748C
MRKFIWYSPSGFASIVFVLYLIPLLFCYVQNTDLMARYVGGIKLELVTLAAVVFFNLLLLLLVFLVNGYVVARPVIPWRERKSVCLVFGVLYLFVGFYAVYQLVVNLDLLQLFYFGWDDHFVKSIGALIPEQGLLRYFFLLQFLILGYFLIIDHVNSRLLLFVLGVFVVAGLAVTTRREPLVVFFLALMLRFRDRDWVFYVLGAAIFSSILALVYLRFDDFFNDFLTSEEFYPFQFSAYLIQESYFKPSVLLSTPMRYFIDVNPGISWQIRYDLFAHDGPGPTVSMAGVFYAYGFLIPAFMLGIVVVVISNFYKLYGSRRSGVLSCIYAFLLMKLLNIMRSGELPIIMIDMFIFLMMAFLVSFISRRVSSGN